MALTEADREALADRIHEAYRTGTSCEPPSATHELDMDDAYDVQDAFVARRCDAEDTDSIGFKVGLTNPTVRDQQGLEEPNYGRLFADTVQREPVVVSDGNAPGADAHDAPRFEPELAFRLAERLEPPLGPGAVIAATATVFPTVEIIRGRLHGETTPEDHVTDNAIHSGVVVGDSYADPRAVAGGDPSMEPVKVLVNGSVREIGIGANSMGDPTEAVAWLAEHRAERGDPLEAGDVVLTGSLTGIIELDPGDTLECRWGTLGSVSLHVE